MCYVETQNKTPSSGYCKGFLIYLRLSFAAAPHGAVFFCYSQACKKLYHAYTCLGFLILACTIYILAPSYVGWYQPSLSLRDISPKGRDKFGLCERANSYFCMRLKSR